MIINGKDVTVEEAIKISKIENSFIRRRNNGLLLSDYQISILNSCNIDYKKHSTLSSLLFEIEDCLNEEDNYELEEVSKQLAEIHYYSETNK